MIKRLSNVILLIGLSTLIFAYVFTASGSRSEIYGPHTADEQYALVVHKRMNLIQAPLLSNIYIGDELVVSEYTGIPGIISAMGATDCQVRVTLNARYGEVEGVTTTVYDLDFEGTYRLRYVGSVPTTTLELIFPFPGGLDTLNQVYFLVDGAEPPGVQYGLSNITWWTEMETGEEHEVVVRYRARGVGSFRYALDHNQRLENLDVRIAVRGLTGSEVPESSLPTTAVEDVENGEQFSWQYDALIADRDVQVTLPTQPGSVQRLEQLQGPLSKLSLASPLLVVLFVTCLAGLHWLSGIRLPFQHYLLAGFGFFLFYPALTFLCAVLDLKLAAAVAMAAVTTLLTLFLGRAAGWRRTWWQTLLLTAVFLGLFSLGAMSRLRGLLFTTGGLLLVGMFMLPVARYRPPQPVETEPTPQKDQTIEQEMVEPPLKKLPSVEPPAPSRYCPHCGTPLDEAFSFCPTCGRDANLFRRCPACGSEHYVPHEADLSHCPACGEPWDKPSS